MILRPSDKFVWIDPDVDRYLTLTGLYGLFLVFHEVIGLPLSLSVIFVCALFLSYWFSDLSAAVKGILQLWISIFFREIGQRGLHHVPKRGAVVFVCAPHANQFLDPLVVMKTCGRDDLGFLIAAKSYRKKVIGDFAKAVGSIPVERPQDLAKAGPGMVTYQAGSKVLKGMGTAFQTLPPGASLLVDSEMVAVGRVISEVEVELKKPLDSGSIDTPKPYKIVPKVDQQEMFEHVFQHLKEGKAFGIFPEGGSHDRPDLLPLKAGVAIMTLGAMARTPGLDVTIIPVGLNYFSGDKFRSRVYADYGRPIYVKEEALSRFMEGGDAKRKACDELMVEIEDGLRAVTLTAEDVETLHVIWAVRRLYLPLHQRADTALVYRLTQRFLEAYKRRKDHPLVKELRAEVLRYNELLEEYGVRDHQVAHLPEKSHRAGRLLVRRYIFLMALAAVAVPGAFVLFPVAVAAMLISEHKRKEALAGSVVKIAAKDVVGTWKLLVSLFLAPLVVFFYALVIGVYLHSLDYALFFLLVMGPCLHATLVAYETIPSLMRSVSALRRVVQLNNDGEDLREIREHLKKSIRKIVDDDMLGVRQEVYPQFDREKELALRRQYSYTPSSGPK